MHAGAETDGGKHAQAHPPHDVLQPHLGLAHFVGQVAAGLEGGVQEQHGDEDEEGEGVGGQPARAAGGGRGGTRAKRGQRAQRGAQQRQPRAPLVQLRAKLQGRPREVQETRTVGRLAVGSIGRRVAAGGPGGGTPNKWTDSRTSAAGANASACVQGSVHRRPRCCTPTCSTRACCSGLSCAASSRKVLDCLLVSPMPSNVREAPREGRVAMPSLQKSAHQREPPRTPTTEAHRRCYQPGICRSGRRRLSDAPFPFPLSKPTAASWSKLGWARWLFSIAAGTYKAFRSANQVRVAGRRILAFEVDRMGAWAPSDHPKGGSRHPSGCWQ